MRARALRAAAVLAVVATAAPAQEGKVDPFPLPPKEWSSPVMDRMPFAFVLLDRFEYRFQKGEDAKAWDAQAWFGGDYNRLWLKSEGDAGAGGAKQADLQALYARRVSPYWHLQAGVRQELRPTPSRTQGVLAAQGLAPYWFNVEASAFLGGGSLSGRLEVEYDQLLTQRLIVQPRVETDFAGSSEPARGVGKD